MSCTWDPKKNRGNIARHGIALEDAARVFEGPTLERRIISAWKAERHEREASWENFG
jgi:uncharacterized DUF497 family protein